MGRPDDRDLDDEIRGHLALEIRERIERGEDPEAARRAALRGFGYLPDVRDSMRRVWYSRWFDAVAGLGRDMRFGLRSLRRSKGLTATVIITLALGIGANAAIFSVVRAVLLRPLVNRDEDRLVYLRQSAPGVGTENIHFSVPEVKDLKARSTAVAAFGEFSTIEFNVVGVGEPRVVRAGVVAGSYFDVMGLRPVLGRLLNASDDGPKAAPALVLTYQFWTTAFNRDPSVVGRPLRLGQRSVPIVGVLEPSIPYPAETEIIANMVTSDHHLGATMQADRTHRMTELFGRLAPGATVDAARAELVAAHAVMVREHPEAYSAKADVRLNVTKLRDQIVSPARTMLILLLACAAIVFIIACSNVANLILARSVRREGELAVRAALGAGPAALRRTLLAESLVLCGAGAALSVLIGRPLVGVVAQFASRFSVRALDVTVDASLLWVGVALATLAAIVLAYIPRLPTSHAPSGLGLAAGNVRMTPATNRRLRVFATAQIALSFVLLAGAATLLISLMALQAENTGYATRQVLVMDVPTSLDNAGPKRAEFYQELTRRIRQLPGVDAAGVGNVVPWRDAGKWPILPFAVDGYTPPNGEEKPQARWRFIGPGFFATLGVPLIAGRDFTDDDRPDHELVAIVSQSIAQRLFPNGDALNRKIRLADMYIKTPPCRIVGIVADADDENVMPAPAMTVYFLQQMGMVNRLFVRTSGDPHALESTVTGIIREMSPTQPVERAATLEDVRAEMLTPERLNAFVLSGFAGVALLIAVVGVSGVLAFSVSARVREFGVRLAIGSTPRLLMSGVLMDGVRIVGIGILAGAVGGYAFKSVAVSYLGGVSLPSAPVLAGAAAFLAIAAIVASIVPAMRAARVDVLKALRAD